MGESRWGVNDNCEGGTYLWEHFAWNDDEGRVIVTRHYGSDGELVFTDVIRDPTYGDDILSDDIAISRHWHGEEADD